MSFDAIVSDKTARHRHERTSWLLCGANAEWCYVCGAWRRLKNISLSEVVPAGPWQKPSGDPYMNPWDSHAQKKWDARMAARAESKGHVTP